MCQETAAAVILNAVKNLSDPQVVKVEILRLAPQDDSAAQSSTVREFRRARLLDTANETLT
jgi:hypothetical protein